MPLDWTTCCSGTFWNDEALNRSGPSGCLYWNSLWRLSRYHLLILFGSCKFKGFQLNFQLNFHWMHFQDDEVLMLEGINRSLSAFQRIKAQDAAYYAAYRQWADTFGLDAPSHSDVCRREAMFAPVVIWDGIDFLISFGSFQTPRPGLLTILIHSSKMQSYSVEFTRHFYDILIRKEWNSWVHIHTHTHITKAKSLHLLEMRCPYH